jgi:hypothetical protein
MRLFSFLSFLSRERTDEQLRPGLRQPKNVARVVSAVAIVAALLSLTTPQFQFGVVHFEKGVPMSRPVVAQFAFSVENPALRTAQLSAELARIGNVYYYIPPLAAADAVIEDLKKIVGATVQFERDNESKPPNQRADYSKLANTIRDSIHVPFTSVTLQALSGEIRSERFLKYVTVMYRQLYRDWTIVEPGYVDDWLSRAVRIEVVQGPPQHVEPPNPSKTLTYPAQVRDKLRQTYLPIYPLAGTDNERSLSEALFRLTLSLTRPNLTFQPDVTEQRRERARASIKPVYRQVRKGNLIIQAGAIPDDFQIRVLNEYNVHIRTYRILRLAAYLALMLAMFAFMGLYMRRFRPLMGFRTSSIVLIGIPLVVVLFVGRVAMVLLEGHYEESAYLFPAPLLGMLAVILLDPELAIIQVLIGSVMVGLATNMSLDCTILALFGGLAAVGSVYRMRQRGQLFRAAVLIAIVNALTIGALRAIEDPTQVYYWAVSWGAINAFLSYVLATGMVPLFESIFGITTDLKLLELTGGHHPLVRELEEKAPGSYQHSLNVAKLAEAAAEAIGANYLLVRAGAHFHDIGKTLKARYFSENQVSPDERRTHDKLTPFMSCLIIRNHVKEGIELARSYGLPEKVIDFIPQHHGTCLIKYFYYEAVRQYEESESAEPVRQSDFRYPGPKPQSIEAAIVMLADSVEAIATSRLTRPNIDADDIRRLVMDAVQDKFSDGQFDECHLTLRQLHEIRESMVRTLLGRFHHRIDYPSPTAAPVKKASKEAAVA